MVAAPAAVQALAASAAQMGAPRKWLDRQNAGFATWYICCTVGSRRGRQGPFFHCSRGSQLEAGIHVLQHTSERHPSCSDLSNQCTYEWGHVWEVSSSLFPLRLVQFSFDVCFLLSSPGSLHVPKLVSDSMNSAAAPTLGTMVFLGQCPMPDATGFTSLRAPLNGQNVSSKSCTPVDVVSSDQGRGVVCTRENGVVCTRETWFVCARERIIFMDFIYFISCCASSILISLSISSCFAYSLLSTEGMHAASSASSIHIISIILRNHEGLQEMLPVRFTGDSGAGMCWVQEGSVVENALSICMFRCCDACECSERST